MKPTCITRLPNLAQFVFDGARATQQIRQHPLIFAAENQKMRHTRKRSQLLLQTFWTGNPLSRMERAVLQSCVNCGYTVHVYTYNAMKEFKRHVPKSPFIVVHDAREILPEDKLFEYGGRAHIGARDDAYKYLPFSDLFRFTMLYKKGGAWLDLDIFMLRPIPASVINRPYVFSSERTIQKGAYAMKVPEIADVGFIKVPGPRSPLMAWLLEHIPTGLLEVKTPFDYMNLYRKGIEALGLQRYVLPARAFRTLNWWDVKDAFGAGTGTPGACLKPKYGTAAFCTNDLKRKDVYGVHWFRAILRKKGMPYERVEDRVVTDNLYEAMVAQIEDDAGLPRDSL